MSESGDIHLGLDVFTRADCEGLAVVCSHPLTGTPRIAVIATGGTVGARAGVGDLGDDLDASIDAVLSATTPYDKAELAVEMAGASRSVGTILEALSYPRDERDAVAPALALALGEARSDAISASVDPRGVEALRAVNGATLNDLQFYSGEGERQDRRRQAAASFPLFASKLASTLSLKMAIDRAKPLLDAVVAAMDGKAGGTISRAAIRKLASVREAPYRTDIDTLLEFASRVPAEWLPTSGEDWRAFCTLAEGIVRQLRVPPEDTAALLKGCSGRWGEFARKLAIATGSPDDVPPEQALPRSFHDTANMIECLADVVVMPLAAHAHCTSDAMVTPEIRIAAIGAARRMVLGDRAAAAVLDNSRRWHHERDDILDVTRIAADERRMRLLADVPPDGWPTLTDPVQAPNGLWLFPLDTPELLRWEGLREPDPTGAEGLHHCVGGYATRCMRADCHIVSVREIFEDGTYRRLSTIEFDRLNARSDQLSVVQNRGKGNGDPSGPAQDATSWYMDMVARGQIPLNRERIAAFQELMQGTADGVERFCGYDWKDREVLSAAVGPWVKFLDRGYRRGDLDAYLGLGEIADVGGAFAPELLFARR